MVYYRKDTFENADGGGYKDHSEAWNLLPQYMQSLQLLLEQGVLCAEPFWGRVPKMNILGTQSVKVLFHVCSEAADCLSKVLLLCARSSFTQVPLYELTGYTT